MFICTPERQGKQGGLKICLELQADLKKKDAEVEALQAGLSSSQAEAGVAQADSAGVTSHLESALQQVCGLRSLVVSGCIAAHCFKEQGQTISCHVR